MSQLLLIAKVAHLATKKLGLLNKQFPNFIPLCLLSTLGPSSHPSLLSEPC